MGEIHFQRYREYVAARVDANNAMIALLAGSRLAAHSLQLHAGSPHQLPGLFPAVRDIDRFNLLPDRASALLLDADAHLAAVAIPYALAVYEAFVKDAIDLVRKEGFAVSAERGALNAGKMHTTFYRAVGASEPADTLALFHVLRSARNAQIHHGGAITQEVRGQLASLTDDQRAQWERLTMADADSLFRDGRLHFTVGHLVASFAVTKEFSRRINSTLGEKLDSATWSRLAVEDYASSTTHPRNSRQWKRGLLGFARFHYLGGVALAEPELERAARDAGYWTSIAW